MMAPDVSIFTTNHNTERTDIPMCQQGNAAEKPVVIGNDVWIGTRATIMGGGDGRRPLNHCGWCCGNQKCA